MRKILIFSIAAATIIVMIAIIFVISTLPHKEVTVTPDKSCTVDSDCALKSASCGPCSCKEPVNKNWTLECPRISKFEQKHWSDVRCMPCYAEGEHFEVKCVSNQCQYVWNGTIINY